MFRYCFDTVHFISGKQQDSIYTSDIWFPKDHIRYQIINRFIAELNYDFYLKYPDNTL